MEADVKFTHAAKVQMAAHDLKPEDIRSRFLEDLDPAFERGLDLKQLIFHSMEYPEGVEWIGTWSKVSECVIIDSAVMQEVSMPKDGNFAKDGPFHGYRIMMPRGESEGDDEI